MRKADQQDFSTPTSVEMMTVLGMIEMRNDGFEDDRDAK
jgi:hypothetical protein